MPIPVSAAFQAAEASDNNAIAAQALLILGNYANPDGYGASASSSGDDPSGDYPAIGAIDGDRTELNVGPAATAEDGVGGASWKSSAVPGGSPNVWLQVDLGVQRTFNRTRLYHIDGHGLSSFLLEYWDGSAWQIYAGSSDLIPVGGGFGLGVLPLGVGPLGGLGPGAVVPTSVTTTMQLDVIDHEEITAQLVRLSIYGTEVPGEAAQVLELELYRLVDITDRVQSGEPSRQRDYKLANNLAASVRLDAENSDKYFSTRYTPTAAEVAAGYVNSELRPGLGLILKNGFAFGGLTEVVQTFEGTLDFVGPKVAAAPEKGGDAVRSASIEARDFLKGLLDLKVSTRLKTNIDIADAVRHLLNLANISDYEMDVDTSSIILDYFFVYERPVLDVVRELAEACGDAAFYFDENGKACFKVFLGTVPQTELFSSQTEWETGTRQNADTTSTPGAVVRKWFLVDDFADGQYTSNPVWTVNYNAGSVSIISSHLALASAGPELTNVSTGLACAYGSWEWVAESAAGGSTFGVYFIIDSTAQDPSVNGYPAGAGYAVGVDSSGVVLVRKDAGTSEATLISVAGSYQGPHTWRVTRDSSGVFNLYCDGALLGTATDNTHTAGGYFLVIELSGVGAITGINWSPAATTDAVEFTQAIWTSPTIDLGATVSSAGTFNANDYTPAGTSVVYYTRTSADGITWEAWVAVTKGANWASTVQRYLEIEARATCPVDDGSHNADLSTPYVYDLTINWVTATGSSKYRASTDFYVSTSGAGLDIEQEMADSLGGDTAIINDVSVQSAPLILTGANTDTVWQGTAGTPAEAISGTNPLVVFPGTYTFDCVVSGGMDISLMSGANPAAAVVTFAGGAVGSWTISSIHPTKPRLSIVVTSGGIITDLRLTGKAFQNTQTPYEAKASDAQSIALYQRRTHPVSNNFIVNAQIAQYIANKLVAIYKDPVTYLPLHGLTPYYSMQLGDTVHVTDGDLGLAHQFSVLGLAHPFSFNPDSAEARTNVVLIKIP